MTTITFNYKGKTREVYQNDAFIKDYSDAPDALAKIIGELTDLSCNLSLISAPWEVNQHLKSAVTIGYHGNKLQFDFYISPKHMEEWSSRFDSDLLKNFLRNLLRIIRENAGIHELDFDEFCNEFGYYDGGRKAYTLYERCCDFSRDIARVFSAEEIESFPS